MHIGMKPWKKKFMFLKQIEHGSSFLFHQENTLLIQVKWVYKIKYLPSGEIDHFKARLAAWCFTQIQGVDFHETFAPIAKLVIVLYLLAIATKR